MCSSQNCRTFRTHRQPVHHLEASSLLLHSLAALENLQPLHSSASSAPPARPVHSSLPASSSDAVHLPPAANAAPGTALALPDDAEELPGTEDTTESFKSVDTKDEQEAPPALQETGDETGAADLPAPETPPETAGATLKEEASPEQLLRSRSTAFLGSTASSSSSSSKIPAPVQTAPGRHFGLLGSSGASSASTSRIATQVQAAPGVKNELSTGTTGEPRSAPSLDTELESQNVEEIPPG